MMHRSMGKYSSIATRRILYNRRATVTHGSNSLRKASQPQ